MGAEAAAAAAELGAGTGEGFGGGKAGPGRGEGRGGGCEDRAPLAPLFARSPARQCLAWSGVVLPSRELGEGAPGQPQACPRI